MKITTILKVAATVVGACAAGAYVYSKVKLNDVQEVETETSKDIIEEVEEEPDDALDTHVVIPVVIGAFTLLAGLMYSPVAMYHYSLRRLAQKAIDNGNLTFEELIKLANNASQEVA